MVKECLWNCKMLQECILLHILSQLIDIILGTSEKTNRFVLIDNWHENIAVLQTTIVPKSFVLYRISYFWGLN